MHQRLEEMVRARRLACIVVPAWNGQLWRSTLKRYSSARLRIGSAVSIVLYALFGWIATLVPAANDTLALLQVMMRWGILFNLILA